MLNEKFSKNLSPKIREAFDLMTQLFEGEVIPGTGKPYRQHVRGTAELMLNAGATETQIIATLLKDLLLKTSWRSDMIKDFFGVKVEQIVREYSSNLPWKEVTNIDIPAIKIAETIDTLSRLDSPKLNENYITEELTNANKLIQEIAPFVRVHSLLDSDFSLGDLLDRLEEVFKEVSNEHGYR